MTIHEDCNPCRHCDVCNSPMHEGFFVQLDKDYYYCTTACLEAVYTKEQIKEFEADHDAMNEPDEYGEVEEGEDYYYWTTWED